MNFPDRQSIRLKGFDYSQNGYYFVTICTQNQAEIFGKIENEKMLLNQNGEIIKKIWRSLPERFPVKLHAYQIMPNHIHGIIQIANITCHDMGAHHDAPADNPADHSESGVGAGFPRPTDNGFPRPTDNGFPRPTDNGFPRPSLGNIIAFFKYQSTKQIRITRSEGKTPITTSGDIPMVAGAETPNAMGGETPPLQRWMNLPKLWQRNYYEHIIRNEREFYYIREYIENNPKNWSKDRDNPNLYPF